MVKKINLQIRSRAARALLRITLSLTTVVAVAVLISYLQEFKTAPATATYIHRGMLEYLLGSAVIAVGGALFVKAISLENAKK